MIQSRFIGIQLSAGQRVGVDKDMAVDMSAVCMCCNDDLTVIPEGLARKRLCDAVASSGEILSFGSNDWI